MARLYPRLDPETIENPGEQYLARALLTQLPDDVEVFHGFRWLAPYGGGRLKEGETDFVVVHPEWGVLFVEVKGGALTFSLHEQAWVRVLPDGKQFVLHTDPFHQVQAGMHAVMDRIRKAFPGGEEALPFTYGFAVAFPDCTLSGALPASLSKDLLWDAPRCAELDRSIAKALARFGPPRGRLDAGDMEAIRNAVYPAFDLLPVAWRQVEDQEAKLVRLTRGQSSILKALQNRPVAAIEGVAGSGKTMLALARAEQAIRDGMRTLLLCYNRPLRDWLAEVASPGELVVHTYHGLVHRLCQEAGLPFEPGSVGQQQEFWRNQAPELLMQALDLLGPEARFDAVVVDEGQDFWEIWWTSLESAFRDPAAKGCYYVFFDPAQNLYVDRLAIPRELGPAFVLTENCRNTVRIARHCSALIGAETSSLPEAPDGEEPIVLEVPTLGHAFTAARRRVLELCMSNQGGLKPSQVAVLAPRHEQQLWPTSFGPIPLTTDTREWRQNRGVLLDSQMRFKGLEADAVICIERPGQAEAEPARCYVARSRAKHLLTVIRVKEEASE